MSTELCWNDYNLKLDLWLRWFIFNLYSDKASSLFDEFNKFPIGAQFDSFISPENFFETYVFGDRGSTHRLTNKFYQDSISNIYRCITINPHGHNFSDENRRHSSMELKLLNCKSLGARKHDQFYIRYKLSIM